MNSNSEDINGVECCIVTSAHASRFCSLRVASRVLLMVIVMTVLRPPSLAGDKAALSVEQAAAKIDGFVESLWSAHGIQPANRSDDATFLRRVTLDLAGRIPTTSELDQFLGDKSKDKRSKVIGRLINGPEFPLHMGSVLDEMIQSRYAGNSDFVDYMRRSIRDDKS
jgi:hypothetical protein